jgi:hypothetical protein
MPPVFLVVHWGVNEALVLKIANEEPQKAGRPENKADGFPPPQYRGTEGSTCTDQASIPPLTLFTLLNP